MHHLDSDAHSGFEQSSGFHEIEGARLKSFSRPAPLRYRAPLRSEPSIGVIFVMLVAFTIAVSTAAYGVWLWAAQAV
jgi:hypothetical protein